MWQKSEALEENVISKSQKAVMMLPCKAGGRGLGNTESTWRVAFPASFSSVCHTLCPVNGPKHEFFNALWWDIAKTQERCEHICAVDEAIKYVRQTAKKDSAGEDRLPESDINWDPFDVSWHGWVVHFAFCKLGDKTWNCAGGAPSDWLAQLAARRSKVLASACFYRRDTPLHP